MFMNVMRQINGTSTHSVAVHWPRCLLEIKSHFHPSSSTKMISGETAGGFCLLWAAEEGHLHIVNYLISIGANVNEDISHPINGICHQCAK